MINIGILGLGTVGVGIVEILNNKKEDIKRRTGHEINIKKILVNDINKKRQVEINENLLTLDFKEILEDETISIILEATSSLDEAYDYIYSSLSRGKHIVTANKAVLSKYLEDLSELAEDKDLGFLYEASVGGGMPILKTLKEQVRSNYINEIKGILNGTSNYILSEMFNKGLDYDEVLKKAQVIGYAEADPSSDVEGHDTMRKLRILATIAFGGRVLEKDIICLGMENIKACDVEEIKKLGAGVKLIGQANRTEGGFTASVLTHICKEDSCFYQVNEAYNSLAFQGDNSGDLKFYGRGAGKLPTANAIVNDLLDLITKNFNSKSPLGDRKFINRNKQIKGKFYLRINGLEDGEKNLWINKISEKRIIKGENTIIFTKEVFLEDLLDFLSNIDRDKYFFAQFQE